MQNVKLIIFDMDGLLFDTESLAFKAYKQSMKSLNYSFSMNVFKKLIGAGEKEEEFILKNIYGNDFDIKSMTKLVKKEFDSILWEEGVHVKPGVHELLDVLDRKNIKRCIASSSSLAKIKQYLCMTNLTNRFDFYISGDSVEKGKPHPDIFIKASHRADVDKKNILVIEDSLNGLKAAKNASMRCVIVPDLVNPGDEMKQDAYAIVNNLDDLIDLI